MEVVHSASHPCKPRYDARYQHSSLPAVVCCRSVDVPSAHLSTRVPNQVQPWTLSRTSPLTAAESLRPMHTSAADGLDVQTIQRGQSAAFTRCGVSLWVDCLKRVFRARVLFTTTSPHQLYTLILFYVVRFALCQGAHSAMRRPVGTLQRRAQPI
jgi:hypothetical protein